MQSSTSVFMYLGGEKAVDPSYGVLTEALESIKNQTVTPRLILLSSGADAKSLEIAEPYADHVVYVNNGSYQNLNIAAHNQAIRDFGLDYILMFSADDVLHPFYVEYAENILFRRPEYDVVLPDAVVFGAENYYWIQAGLIQMVISMNTMLYSSVFRKSLFEKLGGFEENMPYHGLEDWDFWIRAYKMGARSFSACFPFYKYRRYGGNPSLFLHSQEIIQWLREKGRV